MQKKQLVKHLLELANHHATFAINESLKTEGIISLNEEEALNRFAVRMQQNGGYLRENASWMPSPTSATSDPISFHHYYIDFQHWQTDIHLTYRYANHQLTLQNIAQAPFPRPTGGQFQITITNQSGETIHLAPKTITGPSLIMLAYIDDRPISPLLPGHAFPVLSVETIKF
ncbi:hypothetical protein [Brevibacillus dissolubilis]|uniref:hypothetical protein n=1 Tax=Brevibacillus dissolubilis TaxID=1844116 RepID=UPI0021000DDC|nr:hypothetical protein [Brevibacillus dissolubilis]